MRNCVSPLCFKGQVKTCPFLFFLSLPPGGRLPLSRGRFPLSGGNGRGPKGVGMMSRRDRGDRDRYPSAHTGADEGPGSRPLSCRGAHCAPAFFAQTPPQGRVSSPARQKGADERQNPKDVNGLHRHRAGTCPRRPFCRARPPDAPPGLATSPP